MQHCLCRNLEEISESIHERRKITQSRLECPDFESINYDLEHLHLEDARSVTSTVGSDCLSGRDSALGSCSLAGESLSINAFDQSLLNVTDRGRERQSEAASVAGDLDTMDKLSETVSRSFSLPEELAKHSTPVKKKQQQPDPNEVDEVLSVASLVLGGQGTML